MTISSTNSRNDYIGNGATATYSYTFKIFTKNDLRVTKKDTNNVETTLVVDTDYTVSISADGTGSITLTAGNLTLNYLLTIRRVKSILQETDIRNQGAFYPEIHEDAFDHFIMVDQQQQDELNRSFKVSETTTGVSGTLPAPEALKLIRWNSAANALENINVASLGSITGVGYNLQLSSGNLSVMPAFDAAGTDTYTVSLSPAISVYETGQHYFAKIVNANTLTNPTINFNSLGAKTIKKEGSVALVAGDMPANHAAIFRYDGTDMILMNPAKPTNATNAVNATNATNAANLTGNMSSLIRAEQSAQNATLVTVTAGGIQIVSVPSMTLGLNDIILATIKCAIVKGGTAGITVLQISQVAGTAQINWAHDSSAANNSEYQNASETHEIAICLVGKAVVAGTATLQLWGSSAGSDATVAINAGQLHALVLKGS